MKAEQTMKEKLMSRRRYLVLLFQRMEDPKTTTDEFVRLALIAERHSRPRWNRKKRRNSAEVAFEKIQELEKQGLMQRMKGTQ